MANFNTAYELTLKNEGGYSNHPRDKGGETYAGIARNYYPKWPGWQTIDEIKKTGPIKTGKRFTQLSQAVKDFFYNEYWTKRINGNAINNQAIANFVYDFAVNSGKASLIINKTIGAKQNTTLKSDSIAIINASNPGKIFQQLYDARMAYVKTLDDYDVFGKGWENRIKKYKKEITIVGGGTAILMIVCAGVLWAIYRD